MNTNNEALTQNADITGLDLNGSAEFRGAADVEGGDEDDLEAISDQMTFDEGAFKNFANGGDENGGDENDGEDDEDVFAEMTLDLNAFPNES